MNLPNKRPLKILLCISTMYGGGSERQFVYLANEIKSLGQDVHVAYSKDGPNTEKLYEADCKIYKIPYTSNYDPRIFVFLVKMIIKIKPDIVHTWLHNMDFWAGMAAFVCRTPFVVSERNSARAYSERLKDRLRVSIASKAAKIVANSHEGKKYWLRQGVASDRLAVIRNGIPFDEINAAPSYDRDKLSSKRFKQLMLYAGSFSKQKNVIQVCKSFLSVLENKADSIACMFGEGPLKEEVLEIKSRHRCGERLLVFDYSCCLFEFLKAADVFVSLSDYEGTPNTVLEASACKCPLVLSDIPEHREFLSHDSAIFVDVNDLSSAAGAIITFLEKREYAVWVCENAYESIRSYSVGTSSAEYLSLYNEIIDGASGQTNGKSYENTR